MSCCFNYCSRNLARTKLLFSYPKDLKCSCPHIYITKLFCAEDRKYEDRDGYMMDKEMKIESSKIDFL